MLSPDPITRIEAALSKVGQSSSDFDLNPDVVLPEGRILKPAAVLVAFQRFEDQLRLVLTKRASHLKHHPGQIALPGLLPSSFPFPFTQSKLPPTDSEAQSRYSVS